MLGRSVFFRPLLDLWSREGAIVIALLCTLLYGSDLPPRPLMPTIPPLLVIWHQACLGRIKHWLIHWMANARNSEDLKNIQVSSKKSRRTKRRGAMVSKRSLTTTLISICCCCFVCFLVNHNVKLRSTTSSSGKVALLLLISPDFLGPDFEYQ